MINDEINLAETISTLAKKISNEYFGQIRIVRTLPTYGELEAIKEAQVYTSHPITIKAVGADENNNIIFNVHIKDYLFEESFHIDGRINENIKILIFQDCSFKGITFNNFNNDSATVNFQNCHFYSEKDTKYGVNVENSTIGDFSFNRGETIDTNLFHDCGINIGYSNVNILSIGGKDLKKKNIDNITITDSKLSSINIQSIKLKTLTLRGISFENKNYSRFDFTNLTIEKELSLFSLDCGIRGVTFHKIDCHEMVDISANSFRGKLFFLESEIKSFYISGHFQEQDLEMKDIKTDAFLMHYFSTVKPLRISYLKPLSDNSHIQIIDGELDNCRFYNINFRNFSSMLFKYSIFTNAIFEYVTWAKEFDVFPHDENVNKEEIWHVKRHFHRQLKVNYERAGDKVLFLQHKAHELRALKKELYLRIRNFQKGNLKLLSKLKDSFDFIILLLNGVTNGYGLSFTWAISVTIGGSLLLTCWLLYSLSCPEIYDDFLLIHWQLVNPTHSLQKILAGYDNIILTALTYFIDALYRIFITLMAYQIITVIRKYTK